MNQSTVRRIEIKYYAVLREQRGVSGEVLETEAGTWRQLYEELRMRYGFSLAASQVRVAVNEEFEDLDASIGGGEQVVFIPPVAGG